MKIADITILVILGIIGGLILLAARMDGELTPIRKANALPRPVHALCLGDSQTAGYHLKNPERDRWCDLLEAATGKEHVTAGYAGVTIDELYKKVRTIATKVNPEVIYISAGVNDIAGGTPESEVFGKQALLIGRLSQTFPNAEIKVLPIFKRGRESSVDGLERPEYWADEWHPNEAGHRLIAEAILSR